MVIIIFFLAIFIRAIKNMLGLQSPGSKSSFNNTFIDENSVILKIKQADPDFSAIIFKMQVGQLYVTLQEAWEAKDWLAMRAFETDALFNMHSKQLQEYIEKKITNHMDNQEVRDITLADYIIDGQMEVLTVRVNACCIDYVADDATGKIISGNKEIRHERAYKFIFVRKLGAKTTLLDGLNPENCPNCGAPIHLNVKGECEYCKTIITNGHHAWLLATYKAW